MMRLLRYAVAATIAAVSVAACSSSGSGGSSTPPSSSGGGGGQAAAATITIKNFQFGGPVTVSPGATVKVTNADSAGHNVVSDDGTSFKTATLGNGDSATFTAPGNPGTYPFSCTLHPSMRGIGKLVVQG